MENLLRFYFEGKEGYCKKCSLKFTCGHIWNKAKDSFELIDGERVGGVGGRRRVWRRYAGRILFQFIVFYEYCSMCFLRAYIGL